MNTSIENAVSMAYDRFQTNSNGVTSPALLFCTSIEEGCSLYGLEGRGVGSFERSTLFHLLADIFIVTGQFDPTSLYVAFAYWSIKQDPRLVQEMLEDQEKQQPGLAERIMRLTINAACI